MDDGTEWRWYFNYAMSCEVLKMYAMVVSLACKSVLGESLTCLLVRAWLLYYGTLRVAFLCLAPATGAVRVVCTDDPGVHNGVSVWARPECTAAAAMLD